MRTIGVEVADKITQMNNNDYMLMDASAVEYKLADGSTTSVQAILESGTGGVVDLTGYKKVYTRVSELGFDGAPDSLYDIIVRLKEGEIFLDYTYCYGNKDTIFPTGEKGVFRIIKGGEENFSDTTVEWFGSSGAYAIGVLNESSGVEKWNTIGGTGKSVYSKKLSLGVFNLLARIKLPGSANTKHILSFSCLNKVPKYLS